MQRDNRASPIPLSILPTPNQAVQAYRSNQGNLTDPEPFGSDPLSADDQKKQIRYDAFVQKYPDIPSIFHQVVNGNTSLFREALLSFVDITYRLTHS